MNSLMEKRMEKLGIGSLKRVTRVRSTKEADQAEIVYLRAVENQARHRMSILSRIYQSTAEHVAFLEKQRLQLEALYAPTVVCAPIRHSSTQKAQPKSREEVLKSWEGMPEAEVERLIKLLEEMQK